MPITYRKILQQLNKLHLLHRIYIQRAAARNQAYFGQMPLLEYIIEHEGCTQKDLADFLHISAPSVAVTVKRLERDGVIQRASDEKDLRCNRLKITQAGLAYVAACRQSFDGVDALAFRGFSDEECAALYGYLQRLTANLETDEFRERSVFSLIDEDERFHAGLQIQEKEEEKKRD